MGGNDFVDYHNDVFVYDTRTNNLKKVADVNVNFCSFSNQTALVSSGRVVIYGH